MHANAASIPLSKRLTESLGAYGEPLLFGLRLWASSRPMRTAPSSVVPAKGGGRSSGEGTGRRRARRGEDGESAPDAKHFANAVCLREANWYATRRIGASEVIQISANRGECGSQRVTRVVG